MTILEVSNGFGLLLPHRVFRADPQGLPTAEVVEIRRLDDLRNATLNNPIFAPVEWPVAAQLPNGDAGNHFIYARFQQPIDIDSVMDASAGAAADSNLRGPISILAVNASTGITTNIVGRAFIGGQTYGAVNPDNSTELLLEKWIGLEGGQPVALTPEGDGFPGTQSAAGFAGAADLVSPNTFVFIPDADGDLSTIETFPAGVQIRMRMTREVRSKAGGLLEQAGLASTTVGLDSIPPEISVAGADNDPIIIPGNGDLDVDPETNILVEFTEPVQIRTIGELPDNAPPPLSAAVLLQFGPSSNVVTVPFAARPLSVYDLSRLELIPAYNFPGSGPVDQGLSCGSFSTVRIIVNAGQFSDLASVPNVNTLSANTNFTTGEGAGLVNAPVLPDAIYVARGGSKPGISVIDLNGFGGGTGNPTYDDQNPIVKGNSNFPNNPNLALQGSSLLPPIQRGTCTVDGGSAGVFSLAKDSALSDLLATSPILESVGDMALGHSLDNTFNNALPFGCQSGGGNICASTGLKLVQIAAGGANTQAPSTVSTFPIKTVSGAENLVSWAPQPNPPPLTFPPLCLSPLIGALEPTSIDTPLNNLLTPGPLPLGNPAANQPPQGLLSPEQNGFFVGPSPPQQNIAACFTFMMRQQVGQFLYVIDRVASQIVVLNSNRFTVIERISLPDPTSMAMSPNLEFIAVTNQNADIVSIIDTNPVSASFHQVTKSINVGRGPTGIAWEPGNEDIFVCNQGEDSVTIISAFTLEPRKFLRNQINNPIEVAITPRQLGFGFLRGVYFAYVLNGDGSVALFESGPNGVNGWGFDDVIGQPSFRFDNPKTIQVDLANLNSAVWIVHENQIGLNGLPTGETGGAAANLALTSGLFGIIPLDPGAFVSPSIRDLGFSVVSTIGGNQLTGVPVDIAFDNQRNGTSLTNYSTQFSAGFPLSINGKSVVKPVNAAFAAVSAPQFMFLAVPNSSEGPGVVDVFNLGSGFGRFDTDPFLPGVQSIPAPGANGLCDFIRQ